MKVILTETIESLGIIGTPVNVAKGYARNFLLPQKKAVTDTPQNRRIMEHAKEREFAQEMAQRLEGVECQITAKVHEEDRLYGSITARDILDALAAKGIELEKRMLLLKEPIKTTGTFKIPVRVYQKVEPEIIVTIVAE